MHVCVSDAMKRLFGLTEDLDLGGLGPDHSATRGLTAVSTLIQEVQVLQVEQRLSILSLCLLED